jgi:hypothetical protein
LQPRVVVGRESAFPAAGPWVGIWRLSACQIRALVRGRRLRRGAPSVLRARARNPPPPPEGGGGNIPRSPATVSGACLLLLCRGETEGDGRSWAKLPCRAGMQGFCFWVSFVPWGRTLSASGVCQSRRERSRFIGRVETRLCTSSARTRSIASIQRSRGDGITSPFARVRACVMGRSISLTHSPADSGTGCPTVRNAQSAGNRAEDSPPSHKSGCAPSYKRRQLRAGALHDEAFLCPTAGEDCP